MSIKFIHTSDWQLGMTRWFLPVDAQARYCDDQFQCIEELGRLADETGSQFIIVAGDIFDTLLPGSKIINRFIDSVGKISVPVYLLPGNHDPYRPGSVWLHQLLGNRLPKNVIVISDECPRELAKLGVEIIGAPFYAKKPAPEPVGTLISNLDHQGEFDKGVFRIIVGHGQVESVSYDSGDSEDNSESRIEKSILEKAVESGRIGYIALGDRHSVTSVGPSGRIFYSGAIQATDFGEIRPNYVLIVEVSDNHGVEVTERTVGKWNFLEKEVEINSQEDVDHLSSWLDNQDNKSRCVVKLVPQGSISLAVNFALEDVINNARDTFAGVIFSKGRNELRVLPNDSDQQSLELTGYAHSAYQELLEFASSQEEDTSLDESKESNTVLDALKLLHSIVNHEELDRVVI